MKKFTVEIHESVAHFFTVEAPNEEAAIRLARARFDVLIDPDICVSLGLDLSRPPTVRAQHCIGPGDANSASRNRTQ